MSKLELNKKSEQTYEPAFHRKDVRKKIGLALEVFLPYYQSRAEMELSQEMLEVWFGKHQNNLYDWLKRKLLILTLPHANYETLRRGAKYVVRQDGFEEVWVRLYGRSFDFTLERARQLEPFFREYMDGRKEPYTTTVGGRLYWDYQTTKKDIRSNILKGYYDYDIQAAMPTLVLQSCAASKGLDWKQMFPTWADYLSDRAARRQSLAKQLDITEQQAKEVFQGMFDLRKFNGSIAGVGKVVGHVKCKEAMNISYLTKLREEAAMAWASLGFELGSGKKAGTSRWRYYEQLEQQVMETFYSLLHSNGTRALPFHDGCVVLDVRPIDDEGLEKLAQHVYEQTNFLVKIERKAIFGLDLSLAAGPAYSDGQFPPKLFRSREESSVS